VDTEDQVNSTVHNEDVRVRVRIRTYYGPELSWLGWDPRGLGKDDLGRVPSVGIVGCDAKELPVSSWTCCCHLGEVAGKAGTYLN